MRTLYLITSFIAFLSCTSQEKRVEEKLQECFYASFSDNGDSLKKQIQYYENYLVRKGILNNSNGTSYYDAYKKVNNIEVDSVFSDLYDPLSNKTDINKREVCDEQYTSTQEYKNSKIVKIDSVIKSFQSKHNISATNINQEIIKILDSSDFELDIFKLMFFSTVETINYIDDSGIMRKLPELDDEPNYSESNYKNSFIIYINEDSSVSVNNSKITSKGLKNRLKKYYLDNTKNSLIELKANRAAKYSKYVEVSNLIQSVLNELRNELSIKTYNKTFDKLESKEKQEIKNHYPYRIK